MKKLFATLLVFVTVISMVACGNTPVTTPATEPGTVPATTPATTPATQEYDPNDPFGKAQLPEIDMDGYLFEVADGTSSQLSGIAETGTKWDDTRYYMLRQLEEDLNCEFNFFTSGTDVYTQAQPVLQAGDKYADYIGHSMWVLGHFVQNGYAVPFDDVPYVDMEKDYWYDSSIEISTINGKTYVLTGDMLPNIEFPWVIIYNKSMISDLGLTDPAQLVKENAWTIDKFLEYCQKATRDNGDNVWNFDDTYGWGSARGDVDLMFYVGMGGQAVAMDENGKWKLTIDSQQSQAAMAYAPELNRYTYDLSDGHSWVDFIWNMFPAGRLMFLPYMPNALKAATFQDITFDFGIVPAPKLNEQQEDYYVYHCHNSQGLLVMRGANLEYTGYVLEAQAAFNQHTVMPEMKQLYKELYLRDDEDNAAMLQLINENGRFDGVLSLLNQVNYGMFPAGTTLVINVMVNGYDFSATYEEGAEMTQLALDEVLEQ